MAASGGGHGGGDPWAWLGLLKWTLNQQRGDVGRSDGDDGDGGDGNGDDVDRPNHHQPDFSDAREPPVPMSEEDKAFLEKVLKEGIINEGDRMTEILQEFARAMDKYKSKGLESKSKSDAASASASGTDTDQQNEQQQQQDHDDDDDDDDQRIEDLLLELRDICEQIDYARAFCHIKGLDYLLGAVQIPAGQVPTSVRNTCLGLISTLCQNNPPVQKQLVEAGAIKVFSDLFLSEVDRHEHDNVEDNNNNNSNMPSSSSSSQSTLASKRESVKYLTKLMQTISATVRDYDLTEQIFEQLPQSPSIMHLGLTWPGRSHNRHHHDHGDDDDDDDDTDIGESLHTKTLFFLHAIVTSDTATAERSKIFSDAIRDVIVGAGSPSSSSSSSYNYYYYYLEHPSSANMIRETSVNLLRNLLERKFALDVIQEWKQQLASLGIQRIKTLRSQLAATTNKTDKTVLAAAQEEEEEEEERHDGHDDVDTKVTGEELNDWETILVLLARL